MKVTDPQYVHDEARFYAPRHAGRLVLDRAEPLQIAREYVAGYHFNHERPTLHHWRGTLYRWGGSYHVPADPSVMQAELYGMLDNALTVKVKADDEADEASKSYRRFKPKRNDVESVLHATRAVVALDQNIDAPTWIGLPDDAEPNDPTEFVPVLNGLLHLPTQKLLPPDPSYFSLSGLGVAHREQCPVPDAWHQFLDDLFGEDTDAKRSLQELFGYALASDTRFQKIFLMVGPKRSGKGTIARVLTAMLGRGNVAGPTLNSLGQNFGLQSLIGKPLAIIADARLSGRTDQASIAERLLSISGEDSLSIPRKHLPDWHGSLPTRFMILTNELPALHDASGALASRFIVWTLTRSFYGKEDHDLSAKLLEELPGILRWSLEGYRRLYQRGRFIQHASGQEAIDELETLGSPVGAFVKEQCVIEPGAEIACDVLYRNWKQWCEAEGRDHPGTSAGFGRLLGAAAAGIQRRQRREAYDGSRYWAYAGIRIRSSSEDPE